MVVLQIEYGKEAVLIGFVPCEGQEVVFGLFVPDGRLVLQVEVFLEITFNDFLLAVGAGIVDDGADEGECGLLHGEAIQGIDNVWCVVVCKTTRTHHVFVWFHKSDKIWEYGRGSLP